MSSSHDDSPPPTGSRWKRALFGTARDLQDAGAFHKLSLIAFFAWIGLGADGLSSSNYGPEEAFRVLIHHPHLAIFIGLASALTIFIITASYNQIISLFPAGGGGYVVASKLLGPRIGMVSGCALLIDYVLTITLSIASGVDALFSFLPAPWLAWKLPAAMIGLFLLVLLNLRGIKESVVAISPVFLLFVVTHAFAIVYILVMHAMDFSSVIADTGRELQGSFSELGVFGTLALLLKAYSMGAGTYTGIEAVSNGLPVLREPKVETARKTMHLMATSLAVTVVGLLISYALFNLHPQDGKTLNALLFEAMTRSWHPSLATGFTLLALVSASALLFVAAQTGFLDGPRVLATMAVDRWFPSRFASLSDRLVTKNGILLMGLAAALLMMISEGAVHFLVILYSINVFITFTLSQLGMVRYWISHRATEPKWRRHLAINGIGVLLTSFILLAVVVLKFGEGGWVTLLITGSLALMVTGIRSHYRKTGLLLKRLDSLIVDVVSKDLPEEDEHPPMPDFDPKGKTAILLVSGYSGLGLHTLFTILREFKGVFSNFVFVQIGQVDAGNLKGAEEIVHLKSTIARELARYTALMGSYRFHAQSRSAVGTDVVTELEGLLPSLQIDFPHAVYFCGQLVFPEESFLTRLLHNYTAFSIQRALYTRGLPVVILPIRAET